MKVAEKPIPSLYCVYLLHTEKSRKTQPFYVGSTPNPRRRLKQHNGMLKGGANRTAKDKDRPWKMITLVSGFPSQMAALQFEWAWQNTHVSKHIPKHERSVTSYRKRNGRPSAPPKMGKPIYSEAIKIRTLQILLRADSFRRWPLEVRFFSKSCHELWNQNSVESERCAENGVVAILDPSVNETVPPVDPQASDAQRVEAFKQQPTTQAVFAIDASYSRAAQGLQRSLDAIEGDRPLECSICHGPIDKGLDSIIVCPSETCDSTNHLTCLGQSFLAQDPLSDALLPVCGKCPDCSAELQWIDLAKDLSLRSRAPAEVRKLLKKLKSKGKAALGVLTPVDQAEQDDLDDESEDDLTLDMSFARNQLDNFVSISDIDQESEDDLPLAKKPKKETMRKADKVRKTGKVEKKEKPDKAGKSEKTTIEKTTIEKPKSKIEKQTRGGPNMRSPGIKKEEIPRTSIPDSDIYDDIEDII